MREMKELFKKEIVYKDYNIENVNSYKNTVYKTLDNEELHMDIYTPKDFKNLKLPAVILVHGEAPLVNIKDAGQYISLGNLLASKGLIAVTFNHRVLCMGSTVTEVISDIDSLINYVINNAESLNINKEKIALWCFSGGTPFGLYEGIKYNPNFIKCIAIYYGAGDIKTICELTNSDVSNEELEKYSNLQFSNNNSPLLIARAGLDNPKLNESLDRFIVKALENNVALDIYNHSTGLHAFDLFNNNERSNEIIKKTLDFLHKYLMQ